MTEKILIPLDGSPFGEGALGYVETMIANLKPASMPQVTLLHVVPIPVSPAPVEGGVFNRYFDPKDHEAEKAEAMAYLEKTAASLRGCATPGSRWTAWCCWVKRASVRP